MRGAPVRNVIVIAGGFGLDTMGASAIRALGLAQMISGLGYEVVVLGKFREVSEAARSHGGVTISGVKCRDILQPVSGRTYASYVHSVQPLMEVVNEYGADRVLAIICYNYPARGAWAMIRAARRRNIAPVLDCTEWYGWEGRKILRNLWRLAGVEIRMRLLTRLAGNIIYASRWFGARFARQHTIRLPFVLNTILPEWQHGPQLDPTKPPHLVYSGSPGIGMQKDRLPVMIAAMIRLFRDGCKFRVSIAGISLEEYLVVAPEHLHALGQLKDQVRFMGKVSHAESLSLLRGADFSVFFRRPDRVSNTGFPTKYVEAATLGVPVISNATSDIPMYLRDAENGILARGIEEKEVEAALRRAITMPSERRSAMTAVCRAEKPFELTLWQEDARVFLRSLRGCR